MEFLIVTLTANPALDLIFSADRLAFDQRAYLQERTESPGGRGVNASMVLHSLGAETLAIALTGGVTGERFEHLLEGAGFPLELVRIQRDIRTNYAITDRQGLTVKLDEPGPMLEPEEIRQLEEATLRQLGNADWLLLCGSLPPGVPSGFYRRMIEKARSMGVKTLLDCGGRPLLDGLDAQPTVVTPDRTEAGQLLERALVMKSHFNQAASQINKMGPEYVLLSLGSRGAVVAHDGTVTEVIPPRVDAVCPIGAGDALNAAMVWAITNGSDIIDGARWGVAAGTASACLPGLEFAPLADIRRVYAEVEVRAVD
jgi:1-phosphofructokinase family hexose kinase